MSYTTSSPRGSEAARRACLLGGPGMRSTPETRLLAGPARSDMPAEAEL